MDLIKQGKRYKDLKTGKYYRIRRGVLVEIPPKWVGQVTTPATIRRRSSKMIKKLRMLEKHRRRDILDDAIHEYFHGK